MEKVKSALEKALEKASLIGELTVEEKEQFKEQEKITSAMAEFYKGKINRDELCQRLKGINSQILKETQHTIASMIRMESAPEEFAMKKDALAAIETLKGKKNASAIEKALNTVEKLLNDYRQRREGAVEEIRRAIEENPQLRMRPVRMPDGRTAMQPAGSIDEAVQAKMAEYLTQLRMTYEEVFNQSVDALKNELK